MREGERWTESARLRFFVPSRLHARLLPYAAQIDDIEGKIACGQVEELIEQAKVELRLIPKYASWKVRLRGRQEGTKKGS